MPPATLEFMTEKPIRLHAKWHWHAYEPECTSGPCHKTCQLIGQEINFVYMSENMFVCVCVRLLLILLNMCLNMCERVNIIMIYYNITIVFPEKIEKLQPEKRRENFSGLQTFPSLVSTVNLQGFLNFDDFKFTIPCKFTGDTKDRKVLNHKKCSNYDFFSRICRRY
jgi:hypothetical protein